MMIMMIIIGHYEQFVELLMSNRSILYMKPSLAHTVHTTKQISFNILRSCICKSVVLRQFVKFCF